MAGHLRPRPAVATRARAAVTISTYDACLSPDVVGRRPLRWALGRRSQEARTVRELDLGVLCRQCAHHATAAAAHSLGARSSLTMSANVPTGRYRERQQLPAGVVALTLPCCVDPHSASPLRCHCVGSTISLIALRLQLIDSVERNIRVGRVECELRASSPEASFR